MTGQRRGLDHFRAASAQRRWGANDRPGFWFLAGLVFAGNALFSAWLHNWWLGIMQVLTAVLAIRAASLAGAARKVRRSASETDPGH
jgi:fatty acid desaturase